MNLQRRINTVCSYTKNNLSIIVLTDNFYLYLAISELFSKSKVIHVKIADKELNVKLKDELSSVALIIDNDIFMQVEWCSILSVFDDCDLAKIIWLQGEKTGGFIPLKHGKNYLLKKNKKLSGFRKDLGDIIYGET